MPKLELLRLNLGCNIWPKPDWVNIDIDEQYPADVHCDVADLPYEDNSVDEIYAGHLVEHFPLQSVGSVLGEWFRVLKPGGKLGVVVPDMAEVFRRYVTNNTTLQVPDANGVFGSPTSMRVLNRCMLYGVIENDDPHWHKACYDEPLLREVLEEAGFFVVGEIDRHVDPRLVSGAWYQFGLDAQKPS